MHVNGPSGIPHLWSSGTCIVYTANRRCCFVMLLLGIGCPESKDWKWQCLGWFKLSAVSSFRNSCSSCGTSSWDSIRCSCCRCWPRACSACGATTCSASSRMTPPRLYYLICPLFRWSHYYRWLCLSPRAEYVLDYCPWLNKFNLWAYIFCRCEIMFLKRYMISCFVFLFFMSKLKNAPIHLSRSQCCDGENLRLCDILCVASRSI